MTKLEGKRKRKGNRVNMLDKKKKMMSMMGWR